MQFPLAHPLVTSIIPGAMAPEHIATNAVGSSIRYRRLCGETRTKDCRDQMHRRRRAYLERPHAQSHGAAQAVRVPLYPQRRRAFQSACHKCNYVYGVAAFGRPPKWRARRKIDQPVVTASASRRAIPRKIAEQRLNAPRPLFDNATQKGDAARSDRVHAPFDHHSTSSDVRMFLRARHTAVADANPKRWTSSRAVMLPQFRLILLLLALVVDNRFAASRATAACVDVPIARRRASRLPLCGRNCARSGRCE